MFLAGDIGGTKSVLALFNRKGEFVRKIRYMNRDHSSFLEICKTFLHDEKGDIQAASFAVAGTAGKRFVFPTNLPWKIDADEIERELKVNRVSLLNDLEASGYGLFSLKEQELICLQGGDREEGEERRQKGNRVLISPGTGLGEAGLFWNGKEHIPFATEGGHVDFAPFDEIEMQLWQYLSKKHHHISYERVLSGSGIEEIYRFFSNADASVSTHLDGKSAAWISEKAREKEPIAAKTIALFFRILARESGNFALKMLAKGGVFIGGGILGKNLSLLDTEEFVKAFIDKGRFSSFLKKTPLYLIPNDETALVGAYLYGKRTLL